MIDRFDASTVDTILDPAWVPETGTGATQRPAYLSSDRIFVPIEIRPTTATGRGVFAVTAIPARTVCVVFGGVLMDLDRFVTLPETRQRHSIQVDDDRYLVCGTELRAGEFVNHSCDPTLHFAGEVTLVARRDIAAGEQLTFDYGTSDSTPYDEFECECGTPRCRVKVTGEDWMRPDLQREHAGAFAPYLQRRIDLLRS